ncbi:E3 ubiquitin-protein ligase TRIM34 isoform X2 [Nycticebus coucang]|uniref:E3 ubiquitin-protein ligase TRIM34 isoform X2 n=1 Tax=Nycticebus coucang TaxID=9470 RepID=UPI00234D3DAE|nr:E3 ubiquitin-protein ligase TRIM34 isoform X2 [Nycticebus coucang]
MQSMASKILLNMEKEVTCPICLKLLTEPLSLGCGHSLCQACITVNDEEAAIGPGGASTCPVCGIRYSLENLRANQHLANIVERLREVKLSPGYGKKGDLCDHHGERLLLFCKEDGKVICWLCERSQEHRGHHTFLVEELGKECQERIQDVIKRLKREQQEAEKLEADIHKERTSWKYQVQTERQRIQAEFNLLRSTLNREEQRELQRLKEEERTTLDNLSEAEDELVQQSQLVKELISELECRGQWSTMELLQDRSGIMKWSEIWVLKKPKVVSKTLKTVFHAPDLSRMLQVFRVDITMNPVNLNLNLVLSEDQRQVTSVPIWPIKYCNYGVLGSQYFYSGKHYWEVDVSKKTAWILGVYCRTRSRSIKFGIKRGANDQNVYSRYSPLFGYWVIGLQDKFKYSAFEDSSSSEPGILTLSMAVCPDRVGIFLDYELGIVSFFNITNHGSLIYKFSKCCFSQPAQPYFNPWNCPIPMTLCPPSS